MGLFHFPRKKHLPKCSECFREINGYVWHLNNKPYCQECYNRNMAIIQQVAGQVPEEYDFEMTIEDVFSIKNHGVIITGQIQNGVIHLHDTVTINDSQYKVVQIDVIRQQVAYAKRGTYVGLHLSAMDANLFKHGDVVTARRAEDSVKKNTFVCAVCKKERPIKYRHIENICADCASSKNAKPHSSISPDEYLDDVTFIRSMRHITNGIWHQYDVLLAARGYGWDMMKDWADYMCEADLEQISQVTAGSLGVQEKDFTASYLSSDGKCKNTPELSVEMGMLSVAGVSKTLSAPMKIVWINQTQVLRFFTFVSDDLLIKKYVETTIRRTFGTEHAMKLGKPIPEGQ